MDLQRIAQEMRPVVYQAGKIALQYFEKVTIERKADRSYVTEADRAVERFLWEEISRRYPEHGFFGEEYGQKEVEGREYLWAIDPVDGTAPFVFGFPIWAVSVGLVCERGCILGFVYLPVLDQMFWNIEGEPAYLNDRRLQVHEPIALGPGTTILMPSSVMRDFEVSYKGRGLAFGSAASNLCYVAKGNIQGGLIDSIRLYDIAAGTAILKAAGGELRYLSGREVDLWELRDGHKTPEVTVMGHPENVAQLQKLFTVIENVQEEGY
jgi:myo-inositol-1(or 4)-monophosphatase